VNGNNEIEDLVKPFDPSLAENDNLKRTPPVKKEDYLEFSPEEKQEFV
jgi:hypothetical protein